MVVVTSGSKYIDIDAYASCIAYAKLLKLKGIDAKAVSTSKLNESITTTLLAFNEKLDDYKPNNDDEYIILDVSNKDFFDTIVKEEKVIGIIDHHPGQEEFWKEKLKGKSRIEFIGAVATIIVELYEKENLIDKLPKELAILLMSAILDNTLNLKAKITTDRDKRAYEKLQEITQNKTYSEQYFKECQLEISKDLESAIINDTKIEKINDILPTVFGQLVIWKKEDILQNKETIYRTLDDMGSQWLMNMICLEEGKSYLISKDAFTKNNIERLFNKKFEKDIMKLDSAWLRKEIIKESIAFEKDASNDRGLETE